MSGSSSAGGLAESLPRGFESTLDTQRDAEAVKRLTEACKAAAAAHPGSCSHAVNAVVRSMLGLDEKGWPHRQANPLVDFLIGNAEWAEVKLDRAYELANQGVVVIGGKKEATKSGHVIIVFPGKRQPEGGYQYFWKKGNKFTTLVGKGSYPLCMSTSSGDWPGARSVGDKTVWDPWGTDEAFAQVRFWAPAKSASIASVSAALRALRPGRRA
jgi:hypothetical protein